MTEAQPHLVRDLPPQGVPGVQPGFGAASASALGADAQAREGAAQSRTTDTADEPFAGCIVCRRAQRPSQLVLSPSVRTTVSDYIGRQMGEQWSDEAKICKDCLAKQRLAYLVERLVEEKGELSLVEAEVARRATQHLSLAEDIDRQFDTTATFGQRVADRVAAAGGSWPFIFGFFVVLLGWVGINAWFLRGSAFDPYPFILLNLILSCLAALQAPIIMMSQNRLAARDRMQANQDFRVNLKSELEIASLHEKVDHLLHSQWRHMVELQEMQIDLLNELATSRR